MSHEASRRPLFHVDLALCAALTVATMLAVIAGIPLMIRLPLVILLALFLPGYALLSALVLKPGLTLPERLLISVAASIGLTILCGLGMATLGIELNSSNWVAALSVVTLVGVAVAWLRRVLKGIEGPVLSTPGVPWRQALMIGLAIVIVADVLLVTRVVAGGANADPPAQLWIVSGADPLEASLGMRAAPEGGEYNLVVSIEGRVLYQRELALGPSEVWQQDLALTEEDRRSPVVARLYPAGSDVEMRYVVLQPVSSTASPATDGA